MKKWIDITQPLSKEIATWPGDIPYQFNLSATKAQTGSVNIGQVTMGVHTGTHVDAPYHFDDEGEKTHDLDVNTYIGKAILIDVSKYDLIDIEVLEKYDLQEVKRVLLKTDPQRNSAVFPKDYTVLHPDVGPYLKKKGIMLIGIDAPSVDPVDSKSLHAHHALSNNGIYILENLLLNDVEAGLYELIALPLKLVGADGSPVRAVIRPME